MCSRELCFRGTSQIYLNINITLSLTLNCMFFGPDHTKDMTGKRPILSVSPEEHFRKHKDDNGGGVCS